MKYNKFLCSIIIPTYNRSDLISLTLDSITKQDVDKRLIEVIVVDDGSSDDTRAVVKSFEEKLTVRYFFQEDKGYRVATARNIGIRAAQGEICVLIDSGIILGSCCISEHLDSHQVHQATAVIGYVYGFSNDVANAYSLRKFIDRLDTDEVIDYFKSTRTHLDLRENYYERYNDNLPALPAPWVFFWTSNVSIRRRDLIDIGFFDPQYNTNWGMEDVDLGYRLHLNNVKIRLNRNADSIHFPHDKDKEENMRQHEINLSYFVDKHKTADAELFMEARLELNEVLLQEKMVVLENCRVQSE